MPGSSLAKWCIGKAAIGKYVFTSHPGPPSLLLVPHPRPPPRYYAKRCFLSLIENLAKHMIILKDSSFTEIMAFLHEAEKHGKDIRVSFADGKHQSRTIASEARMLKKMFLKLRD